MWYPFRMKFWVLASRYINPPRRCFKVTKSRTSLCSWDYEVVDGPFYSQEDAARSLAFWRHQEGGANVRKSNHPM